jgi:hypothetical protein
MKHPGLREIGWLGLPRLAVLVLASVSFEPRAAGAERAEVRLTAYDAVAPAGGVVPLRIRLEYAGVGRLHFPMHGFNVTFTTPRLASKEARTGEDGVASLPVQVPTGATGLYHVNVNFNGDDHHKPGQVTCRIFVWPQDSLILITDVDHTISDLSQLKVPFTSVQRTPPLPGAPEALRDLAHTYRIIYLSARDQVFYQHTQTWLDAKGFPEGPLFCRHFHLGEGQEQFKRQFIADLKKRYPKVAVGVGDQPGDANAYLANGMKAFLINPGGRHAAPRGSVVVSSWQEVWRQLSH